jgi:hypothetical protein
MFCVQLCGAESVVAQPVKKFSTFYSFPNFHYHDHKSLPVALILSHSTFHPNRRAPAQPQARAPPSSAVRDCLSDIFVVIHVWRLLLVQ